jgi:glycosyltransferase involved in cell wall biosynthesis
MSGSNAVSDRTLASVVIPALNAAATLGECLRAIHAQSLSRSLWEVIVVVDDRSSDETEGVARAGGARVIVNSGRTAAAARNAGIRSARGDWVAFTDADCVPTRRWLEELLTAVGGRDSLPNHAVLGATGPTIGLDSDTPAARYVDLTAGLDAERHLTHPIFPWAPTGNVIYRRDALLSVDGFDDRFNSYEGCDLHTRLRRTVGGEFHFVKRGVVMHRHRPTWHAYWRQQVNYGRGFAQFFMQYTEEIPWSAGQEARAWASVARLGLASPFHWRGDGGLVRRGRFIKALAQRWGFATTFWRPRAASRWRERTRTGAASAG